MTVKETAANAPTLALGEDVGDGVIALTSSAVSTGDIYSQISTNAATGAIVSMKSNATGCGGLLLAGSPGACNIGPALALGIGNGDALFGVKVATDAAGDIVTGGTGALQASGAYDGTDFKMNYVSGDATGVTSIYGDPILNTNSLPVNGKNMKLTFGASVANTTAAGKYSADLSMIATGKF